ncbi:low molecular weight protein tyrosine phosphatase family protein [Burkholderia ambifaria]|uniref:low molecular weight protein tyrosine phosphatase family protein n=1 Tax=Burkholderia ambifaria TaxID=152480 RepID=UPI001FC868E7|nr:phosphotyrosine protein phosphatase [Burkholderia ambifaria]
MFAGWPGVETDSAGLAPDADTQVSTEQLEWAEIVFVMERAHKAKLTARFGARLKHKKIVCLDIPDRYAYMQPELIALLERKVGPLLRA